MKEQGFRLDKFLFFTILILVLGFYSSSYAQELEPRSYSNIPIGLNFALAGYGYTAGGVLFDPSVPLENANIKIHGSVFAYARSVKVGGKSAKISVVLPYAWLSGSADFQGAEVTREVSGLGDPKVKMSVNILGAPALQLSEFKDYSQNWILGVSMQITAPISQYESDRLVNIGTNRFSFKPELGVSKRIEKLLLEMSAGLTLYTANNDFYQGVKRLQAPIGSMQAHAIYNFKNSMWAALDGTYYWGGKTTTDGIEGNDLQKNTRLGFIFALPINRYNSLKLQLSTGVSTRTGSDFDAVIVAWQYRWGKSFRN